MGLSIGETKQTFGYSKPVFDTNNKFLDGVISIFYSKPGYYEEITSKDGFIDKIQKAWNNNTAYMPETGKRGLDLVNAKLHNFIAAMSYAENPFGLLEFIKMQKLDRCRLG